MTIDLEIMIAKETYEYDVGPAGVTCHMSL